MLKIMFTIYVTSVIKISDEMGLKIYNSGLRLDFIPNDINILLLNNVFRKLLNDKATTGNSQ